MRPLAFAAILTLVGCKPATKAAPTTSPADAGPVGAKTVVLVVDAAAPPEDASAAASYAADAGEVEDFEDLFAYGAIDAGAGDPATVKATKTYAPYWNARYHFAVDVPTTFAPMPAPDNGDGMQWRVGRLVAMNASAIHNADLPLRCPNSKHVTKHRTAKSFCWVTGTKDGFIFWMHRIRRGDVDYDLAFQYAESLKDAMDPIVTHVSASWNPPSHADEGPTP